MPGYTDQKDAHRRRVDGQIHGLQRIVDDDTCCIDVPTQVSAATRALQSFALELLNEHTAGHLVEGARAGDAQAEAKVREALEAIARLVRR